MHLKFLARGTGSAAAAAAYLLAEWDAAGTRRAAVEVLRGDPHEVAAVADGLPFKHRYTSGLMAWSPEDAPTRAELERVVDEFEETAWTGLERDRYVWAVILHRDHDGGVHLHIFAARCDLATGRSLNIAPPGWQKTFDPLRDALNFEHGWSRPDDPARARPNRPAPYRAYLDAETLRAGWEVEPNPRELIGQHLMARVAAGTVTDRAGVVAALEELDLEVTRQGEHYVTARHPETGDRWRLKGTLYERDFDRERFVRQQAPEPSGDREPADRGDDAARAAEAWQEVEEQRGQRAKYHQARYGGSREGRAQAGGARDAAGDVERESGPAAAALGREAGPESLAGHLQGELGDDAVVAAEDSAAEREQELEAIRGAAAGDATACLAVLARVDVVHDRDRAAADSGLASVVHAVRAGAEAAGRADRVLAGAGRVLAGAGRTARGCGDALDRAIRDAGPDLAELMRQRQEQRALAVAGREQAVCAMSKGAEWLDEVRQEVLADADRRPTVAEKERIVEPVEDRIRIYLAGLEESLAATSAGAALLREEYGEGGAAAAPLQSFAKQEAFVEQVAQQVDKQLGAREEVLRSLVERYLSEAKEALTGGVEGSLPRAERESKLNAVERLVGEELDRREEQVRAIAGSDRPIEEAIEALMEDGTISGDGSLTKRAQIIETAEGFLKDDLADLEAEEAAILKEPAGEERLRNARVEVLDADREAKTVVEHEAIIDLVQLAIREDTLRQIPLGQQYLSEAEQARTREGPPTQAERKSMVNAVEQRVREELDRREKRLKASERGAVLLADGFDELTGGSGSGRTLTQRWQIIDRAESWREEDLTECVSRVAAQFDARGGDEVLFAALDKQKKPGWRKQETLSAVLDQALAAVEKEPDRREEAPWHDVVLKAEQKFPHATSQTWHEAGDGIDRSTVIDRHAGSISQTLSDRARVRALAAEESEPAPARNLVQRVIDWLRAQVERLLRERVAAAEAEDRRKREAAAAAARQQREAAAAAARQQREAAAAAARQQREAAAAAARQQRWNDLEAFPGAQDAASARFDRLEPGWRDKGSVSRQCFNQVVGEIEERIDKSLNKQEERLRDRNRSWDYQERDRAENLLERACADVLGSGKKPSTWQERARVLDTAELLDVADRAFEAARHEVAERWAMKVTPPHHTVQEAAAAAVDLEVVRTPWDRAVAEAIVGGKAQPRYDDPAEGEAEQFVAKFLAADKSKAERAADQQHREELNAWRQKNRLFRGSEPERPQVKDPEPPEESRVAEMREAMIRFMRNRIVSASQHYEPERERERDNRAIFQEETRSPPGTRKLRGRGR